MVFRSLTSLGCHGILLAIWTNSSLAGDDLTAVWTESAAMSESTTFSCLGCWRDEHDHQDAEPTKKQSKCKPSATVAFTVPNDVSENGRH